MSRSTKVLGSLLHLGGNWRMLLRMVCEMQKSNWCERQGMEISFENGGPDAKCGSDEMIGLSIISGIYPSHNIDLIDFCQAFSSLSHTFIVTNSKFSFYDLIVIVVLFK
jgi:hypothetical protein